MPRVTRSLALGGLLAVECERVAAMLADPMRSAAIVVTSGEELAVEETLEFWPHVARDLGRPPVALVINSSVAPIGALPEDPRACPWFAELAAPPSLAVVYTQLARRARRERLLADRLAPVHTLAIADAAFVADDPSPRDVIALATAALEPLWGSS